MTDDPQTQFKTRFATSWVLILASVILIVWDLYARQFSGSTISELALSQARSHPVYPFLFGVLGGHLFWPQEVKKGKSDV